MSSNESEVLNAFGADGTDTATTKTYPHVPPRIDPDIYQADVPEWSPPNQGDVASGPTGSQIGRKAYSSDMDESSAVREFLVIVRNMVEPICPLHQKFWIKEQTQMPLESDVLALEFLASYDYNVDKALFGLYCELGRGKDALYTGRTVSVADRTATNVIFTDCRERIFRASAQPALGFYPAMLDAAESYGATNGHRTGSANLTSAITSALLPVDERPRAVVSALICHPRLPVPAAAGEAPPGQAATTPLPAGASLSAATALDRGDKGRDGAEEGGAAEGVLLSRAPKPRAATADKAELRRKWLNVAQRAHALLGPHALSSSASSAASHNSATHGAAKAVTGSSKRGSLCEAQSVLDVAYGLPPFTASTSGAGSGIINSSSAASLTNAAVAAASEEAFLLDNLSMLLGRLVKAVLAARFLIAEIRDSIYTCSIDAVILTHAADVRSKGAGNKKGNAESLLKGLHELVRELGGQPLCAEVEERQLRAVAADTEVLLRDVRAVLKECLAWEATPAGQAAGAVIAAGAIGPRGRPAAYTPAQVKALLQHHVQLCAADGQHFEQSAFERRPTMHSVAELLRRAAINPVQFSEVPYLAEVHSLGLAQVDEAATILVRAAQLAEARSRLTLDRLRYKLADVQALLVRMHTFPFRSEEVDALQVLVSRAEAWREEVIQLSAGALKPQLTGDAAAEGGHSSSRATRKTDSAHGSSKPIPLKKVEALIAEGERFPFELVVELELLKEKRQLAKVWLDKLKRSFVPTKPGSSRVKRGGEEGTAAEKLSLADMRMMVSEGASLYQEPLEDEGAEGDRSAAVASVGRSGVVSSRTANRELDRAQAVVETAEDWITRVRDLLCGGSDSDEQREEPDGGHGEEEADDEVAEQERTMEMLRAMLEEAESMPVTLDECGLLRHHLQALEWAAKVRPLLAARVPVKADEDNGTDADAAVAAEGKPRVSRSASGLPRLSELQQYAKDITRIRAAMSTAGSSSELPVKPLPEETACLALVADAEKWVARVKKVLQGSAVRKGTKLARLQVLCEEGEAIPVHFESELRPLRAALVAAEAWEAEHRDLLLSLRPLGASAEGTEASEGTRELAATGAIDDEKASTEPMVDMSALRSAAISAAQLPADFDSSRLVQELLQQVDRWTQRVDRLCGLTTVKQEVADTAEEDNQRPGKRRKGPHGGAEADSTRGDDAGDHEAAASHGSEAETAGSAAERSDTAALGMVTVEQLVALTQQGRSFGVDLEEKVQLLTQLKLRADNWDREARAYITGPFAEALKRIFVEYKRLISDYTASDNGAVFCFLPNRKPSALTPGNQAKAAKEEGALNARVQTLLAEVLQVRAHCETIGVETPFYHAVLAFIRLLEWVEESRNVACHQLVSRRPATDTARVAVGGKSRNQPKAMSFAGWEDLRTPIKLKNWGDVDARLVLALVQEGEDILGHFYPLEGDEKFPGMVAHYAKGLLAPAADFQEQVNPVEGELNSGDDAPDSGSDGDGDESEGDGAMAGADQDDVAGGSGGEEGVGAKKRRHRDEVPSARKRKLARVGGDASTSQANGGKSTRGSSGIIKKRVDDDFAESVNLNQLGAGGGGAGKAGKGGKRPRGGAPAATPPQGSRDLQSEAMVSTAPLSVPEPVLELDLARTAHREGLAQYLATHRRGPDTVRFSPAMGYMVDLWLRVLKVYALRLRMADRWVRDARRLLLAAGAVPSESDDGLSATTSLAATGGATKAHTGEEIERLLAEAALEGIQSKYRALLEVTVQESKEWLRRAAEMRTNPSALLSMDDLKAFLKAGERVVYVQERNQELQDLRGELKRARQWKARLEKSGFDTSTAPAELLTELADEARTIRVNLSEFTDSIVQVNKTYCLCRQAYHGQMVGCDTCEEWYHFQCVGLSSTQAEKCAKYVCIRCALKNSIAQAASTVAQLTNKWMNCVEHFRRRDESFQKIAKKLFKDEKELGKARAALKALVDATPPSAAAAVAAIVQDSIPLTGSAPAAVAATAASPVMATSAGQDAETAEQQSSAVAAEAGGEPLAPTLGAPASAPALGGLGLPLPFSPADAEKLVAAKREVDQLHSAVMRAAAEKEKLARAVAAETTLHKEVFRWMQAMQELLWPCTEEQVALGAPVGPSSTAPLQTADVLEYTRALLGQLPALLPVGLQHMERAAALVGIVRLEDVALTLDAFRWMGWANLCLHMLRMPPTTPALRRLLDASRGLQFVDEKVLKLLHGVLQRATAWKGKARKILTGQQKKLDLARLQGLALEGNSIALTSRLKDKLRDILPGHPAAGDRPEAAGAATGEGITSTEGILGKGAKRGPKAAAAAPAAAQGAATASAPGASWGSEVWASRILASGVEECASSDEEDLAEASSMAEGAASQALASLRSPYTQRYAGLVTHNLAVVPEAVWPPQLQIARRRPGTALAAAAPASAPASSSATAAQSGSAAPAACSTASTEPGGVATDAGSAAK